MPRLYIRPMLVHAGHNHELTNAGNVRRNNLMSHLSVIILFSNNLLRKQEFGNQVVYDPGVFINMDMTGTFEITPDLATGFTFTLPSTS